MTTTQQPAEHAAWYALSAEEAARAMGVDPGQGLGSGDVTQRLAEYGPNQLPTEPPPSMWTVARGQLANPMNIMLLIVCGASFAIAQWATAVVVLGHGRDAAVHEVAGERALFVVQIDGSDLVSALEQGNRNMHRKGRLAAATLVVAEQNHMRPGW